jgi:hypothetical protein
VTGASQLPDTFDFAFSTAYRAASFPFGVRPRTAEAVILGSCLHVRFGPWRLNTTLENVADIAVTGPYAFVMTAGPARLAVTDRGLTFATNSHRGVRLRFRRKVPGIEPTGLLRHPELTLTVRDIDRFVARVSAGLPASVGQRSGVPST